MASITTSCTLCGGRIERLGYNIPEFDFRLKGVTSMTADIHKYGLGPKVWSPLVVMVPRANCRVLAVCFIKAMK